MKYVIKLRCMCTVIKTHVSANKQIIRNAVPSYSTGGILADVMGLGKTLTMLSSIATTLDDAKQWSTHRMGNAASKATWRSRATLVVVPSMRELYLRIFLYMLPPLVV